MFLRPLDCILKITGPVHLLKQPPSVDGGYLHNNVVTEYNVPRNEASRINYY